MEHYEVFTYNVGQGLFNLLRIKSDRSTRNEWLFCGVFDCGSTPNSPVEKTFIGDAIDKINEAGRLDCLVISHQDKDHWSYVINFICRLYDLIEDTWYKSDNHFFKFCKKGNISIVEKYWDGISYQTQATERKYTCTLINGDTLVDLTRIVKGNELSWCIEVELSDRRSICFNIFGKFEGSNIVYTRIWRAGIIPDPSERLSSQRILEEIRAYFKKHASHFGCSDLHVPKISEMIVETFQRSITFAIESKKILHLDESDKICDVFLGGAGGKANKYNELWGFLKDFAVFMRRIESAALLYITDYKAGLLANVSIDSSVSQNSNQSPSIQSIRYNATSLTACFVLNNGRLIVFPGDATIHTFGSLHKLLKSGYGANSVEFITAPHHGAFDTNIALDSNGDERNQGQTVMQFFDTFKPQKVAVSALHTVYGHPSGQVVRFMMENAAKNCGSHRICGYGNKKIKDLDEWTDRYLYTTECSGNLIATDNNMMGMRMKEQKTKFLLPSDDMFISRNEIKL